MVSDQLHIDILLTRAVSEINTSCVMGLMKEIVVDRSICGRPLEQNIVLIAACNPVRSSLFENSREKDLGRSWVSGHYRVAALPTSLSKLRWSFGSLTQEQEKEFVHKRIGMSKTMKISTVLQASLTERIVAAHEKTRELALQNMLSVGGTEESSDVYNRVRSVVSLRDIQRVFDLFEFFLWFLPKLETFSNVVFGETEDSSMVLAIAVVYYLRLDGVGRIDMAATLNRRVARDSNRIEDTLEKAVDIVFAATQVPSGIAPTRGLRENLFAVLVCSLSRTPLIVVGPPGTAKVCRRIESIGTSSLLTSALPQTLAVNIIADNAKGPDSTSALYRVFPMLSFFHYQCSKRSTSKEIAAVFDQAVSRQRRLDYQKHRCVVFMDEAGLPEEERESLKVLHYLLEGHMSKKCEVAFVAISNHILDAAKSNRCVVLLRQEPDNNEMIIITTGVLFDHKTKEVSEMIVRDVKIDRTIVHALLLVKYLCKSYLALQDMKEDKLSLDTWFGLRDYVYFLACLKDRCRRESTRVHFSLESYAYSIERNFGGVTAKIMSRIGSVFLAALSSSGVPFQNKNPSLLFRTPLEVIVESLSPIPSVAPGAYRPRYKLIIDSTEDASILRLLRMGRIADISQRSLHMLSTATVNPELERLRLISKVKFAAQKGEFVVLSQTEPIKRAFMTL
jgi:hypothetical protein